MKFFLYIFLFLVLFFNNSFPQIKNKILYQGDSVYIYNTDIIAKSKIGNESRIVSFFKEHNLNFQTDKYDKLVFIINGTQIDSISDRISVLTKTGLFKYVEPNFLCTIQDLPNDPEYTAGKQWAINKIHLPEAWNITKGSSDITIGILDSGIPLQAGTQTLSHPDLNDPNRYLLGANVTTSQNGLRDMISHGTHVLGIIGAKTNNNIGVAGVNWNSKFRITKVFPDSEDGSPAYFKAGLIEAVNAGVKIINYSGGGNDDSNLYREAIVYAGTKGVLVIASAGNNLGGMYPNGKYPARYANDYDNLISVNSTRSDDGMGLDTPSDQAITLSAPGVDIWSTYPDYPITQKPLNYGSNTGTSMAAPFVAGVASLMLSANPYLKPGEIKSILMNTSEDLGTYGRNDNYGSGRLDAFRAVKAAQVLNSYSNAVYKVISKKENVQKIADKTKMFWRVGMFVVSIYKLTAQFDLTQYMENPANCLYWFNVNGTIDGVNRGCNKDINGNIVTVTTYNYEIWTLSGNYLGYLFEPNSFQVDLIFYGKEPGAFPGIPKIIKTEYVPVTYTDGFFDPKITWKANCGDGTVEYEIERRLKYSAYTEYGNWEKVNSFNSSITSYQDSHHGNGGTDMDLDRLQLRIRAKNSLGQYSPFSEPAEFRWDVNMNKKRSEASNEKMDEFSYALEQNFPNPFNPITSIKYSIKNEGHVLIQVFDVLGKKVATLVDGSKKPGEYSTVFDASNLSSGIYFTRIATDNFSKIIKMQLIK